jgi:hypothetical protein
MNQPATSNGQPIMKRLVKGIEHKARMGRSACPPTDDTAGEGIDYKGHVDEALPGRDIGEIGLPQHVRRGSEELSVHPVERTWSGLVRGHELQERICSSSCLS